MIHNILAFLSDFGPAGLFIHAMIDAIIFPIPAFFLQVSLSAINPGNALWLATVGFVGCMFGTPIGYAIGRLSGQRILRKFMKPKKLDAASDMFSKHGEVAILIGSFTPIPFKLFTILAGFMNFPLWKLLCYAAIGRAVKFYIVGILFYVYGRAAERMVGSTLTISMLGIGVLLTVVVLLIRKLRQRRKLQKTSVTAEE